MLKFNKNFRNSTAMGKFFDILLVILAAIVFFSILKAWGPWVLLLNIIIALIALKLLGWLGIRIKINIWSILIVLIGGIPGLLILVFLSVTGIAFRGK
jgi:hypothetical protein